MPVLIDIDPALYTRSVTLDVPSLIAMARQLRTAAPARPKAPLKQSLQGLVETTDGLEAAYREHLGSPESLDSRLIDQMGDNSWSCFYSRLDSYACLPATYYPKVPRAQALKKKLFPAGLAFLKLEYGAQWTEAEQRIQVIQSERLKPELEALVGAEFVAELYRCHTLYTEMVGVSRPKQAKKKLPDLRALRLTMQQALAAHSIQLLALYMSGNAKQQEAVRPSFAVIDAYRDKTSPERKSQATPEPTPSEEPAHVE
jgi:hypothetical protein